MYHKAQSPSLSVQALHLKRAFPSSIGSIKGGVLSWRCVLQPTEVSAHYTTELICKQNERPTVWVSGDNIINIEGIPHKYDTDSAKKRVEICLYLPNEYDRRWIFSDTIILWAIEWLYFYEMWLATGAWLGGGQHPYYKGKKDIKL